MASRTNSTGVRAHDSYCLPRAILTRGLQSAAALEQYDGQHPKLLWRRCCSDDYRIVEETLQIYGGKSPGHMECAHAKWHWLLVFRVYCATDASTPFTYQKYIKISKSQIQY